MSKINTGGSTEVYFSILTEEDAAKLEGLDAHSKMVYRVIESSGDKGIWTVDVRGQTNIPQGTLTKIFKVSCCDFVCRSVVKETGCFLSNFSSGP